MEINNYKIIYSAVFILAAILTKLLATVFLRRIQRKFGFQKSRIIIINKIISFILYIIAISFIVFVWGVDEEEFLLFVSSFLTVLGIALFAQWSILSNITAGIIIFISYPVKIGDTITILEKNNNIKGEIRDIGVFFITLQTKKENFITIPNSILLQKSIRYL